MRPFLRMFTSNAQIIEYGVRYSKIVFLFANIRGAINELCIYLKSTVGE